MADRDLSVRDRELVRLSRTSRGSARGRAIAPRCRVAWTADGHVSW